MDTPQAPDPTTTAATQAKYNQQTAQQTQELNMVDQNTPYGSLSYNQTGTAADGTPQYTSTTSLTPGAQSLYDSNLTNATQTSNLENSLLGSASSSLSKPLDLGWGATEANLDALGRQTLDPQFAQANEQQQQQLYNQGLRPGDASYDYATGQQQQSQGQQYNNLYLQGHQQAVSDLEAQYNSPLNALSALRSGTQVSQPGIGTTATPQATVAGTNYSGLVQSDYQDQLAASNATMGGLFGLGGTLGGSVAQAAGKAGSFGALFSDERLKTDVDQVGELDNGLPVYSYRYKAGGPTQIGLMAQDVEKVNPGAVGQSDGFKTVDYARATSGGLFGLGGKLNSAKG